MSEFSGKFPQLGNSLEERVERYWRVYLRWFVPIPTQTVYCVLCTVYCVLCTVYCVLCTVYCVLCTVYCVLCTVYCVLCTVYCVLCTVYCVLCTVYCVLCTVYCVLCTVYCVLCTVYCVLCTVYCVLCTVYCVLCTVYCVLCTVYCVLCTVYCVLCTVYCVLCTVYCVLCTVYCVLCTVYCVLCTVYCVLCTVYCVLCTVYCVLCTVSHLKGFCSTKVADFFFISPRPSPEISKSAVSGCFTGPNPHRSQKTLFLPDFARFHPISPGFHRGWGHPMLCSFRWFTHFFFLFNTSTVPTRFGPRTNGHFLGVGRCPGPLNVTGNSEKPSVVRVATVHLQNTKIIFF